ncbi:MAG TPA: spore germination protein [Firmicutes bacterium]|nr:spore germination protein [Bacillota bacterium]
MRQERKKRAMKRPRPIGEMQRQPAADHISGHFENDFQALQDLLANNSDLRTGMIRTEDGKRVALFFYAGLIDQQLLNHNVVGPIQRNRAPLTAEVLLQRIIKAPNGAVEKSLAALGTDLAKGAVIILMEGLDEAITVTMPQFPGRGIERSQSEDVLIGPHQSFCEDLNKNLNLLRRYLKIPQLKIKNLELGRISKTDLAIVYIEGVAQEKLVREVEERLGRIDIDFVLGASYLIEFLEEQPFSILPQLKLTERPDRVVAALSEGRVAILAGGDPVCLVVPFFVPEAMQSAEDYYEKPLIATFLRWLRLFSAALSIFLPGTWITLVSFHHGIIPPTLFNSIVTGRENVPFPTIIEAFLLLIAFDIVIEASTRLPSAVGQAVGIVGAIILGQSAVQASLISPTMIIVVALAGLAVYTLPSPSSVSAIRVLKYLVLAVSSVLGLFGTIWAFILITIKATSMRSFGYPSMFPVAPLNVRGWTDIFLKLPNTLIKQRPHFLAAENERRLNEGVTPYPGKDEPRENQNPDS